MCVHFVPKRNSRSSLSRNPTSNFSMVYTYQTSSDFLKLNSHTWPWILWIFYCLSMTCFDFSPSSGERVQSFLNTGRLTVVFRSYTVLFVLSSSIIKQLLLRNNCIDGSHPEYDFLRFCFSALISGFSCFFFWNVTAVSIFGQRLNDTSILSDADPDKHTTYETFSELFGQMTGLIAPGCVSLQNVRPLLRFNYVIMNLWWLKITHIMFFLLLYM